MNTSTIQLPSVTPSEIHALKTQFVQQCRLIITLEKTPFNHHQGLSKVLIDAINIGSIPYLFTLSARVATLILPDTNSTKVYTAPLYDLRTNGPKRVLDGLMDLLELHFATAGVNEEQDRQQIQIQVLTAMVTQVTLYLDVLKVTATYRSLNEHALLWLKTDHPQVNYLWQLNAQVTPNEVLDTFLTQATKAYPKESAQQLSVRVVGTLERHTSLMNQARAASRRP